MDIITAEGFKRLETLLFRCGIVDMGKYYFKDKKHRRLLLYLNSSSNGKRFTNPEVSVMVEHQGRSIIEAQSRYKYMASIWNDAREHAYEDLLKSYRDCINCGFSTCEDFCNLLNDYFVCPLHPLCYFVSRCPRLQGFTPILPEGTCEKCSSVMSLHDLIVLPNCNHVVCLKCLNMQVWTCKREGMEPEHQQEEPWCPIKNCDISILETNFYDISVNLSVCDSEE
jgi:hypothetical protein